MNYWIHIILACLVIVVHTDSSFPHLFVSRVTTRLSSINTKLKPRSSINKEAARSPCTHSSLHLYATPVDTTENHCMEGEEPDHELVPSPFINITKEHSESSLNGSILEIRRFPHYTYTSAPDCHARTLNDSSKVPLPLEDPPLFRTYILSINIRTYGKDACSAVV